MTDQIRTGSVVRRSGSRGGILSIRSRSFLSGRFLSGALLFAFGASGLFGSRAFLSAGLFGSSLLAGFLSAGRFGRGFLAGRLLGGGGRRFLGSRFLAGAGGVLAGTFLGALAAVRSAFAFRSALARRTLAGFVSLAASLLRNGRRFFFGFIASIAAGDKDRHHCGERKAQHKFHFLLLSGGNPELLNLTDRVGYEINISFGAAEPVFREPAWEEPVYGVPV